MDSRSVDYGTLHGPVPDNVTAQVLLSIVRQTIDKRFIGRSMGKKSMRAYARFHRAIRDKMYFTAREEAIRLGVNQDALVGVFALLEG